MGWVRGFEPPTTGSTVQGSTIELHPPPKVAMPDHQAHTRPRQNRNLRRHRSGDATPENGGGVPVGFNFGSTGFPYSLVNMMARLEGFEPPTHGLEIRCSIQLSYRRSFHGYRTPPPQYD
jgi:hypothetical protein